MNKIAMETSDRMRESRGGPAALRLFAAALACVVADCDSSTRPQREEVCLAALEACAESLGETAGTDVAEEMKRIFSAMNREISTLDAISDNLASSEAKKKSELKKGDQVRKELLKEVNAEREGQLPEVKERAKRDYAPPFRFPSFSTPLQLNPTVESVIADKLLKSPTFNNFFKFGLSQEDALFQSRSMINSGLSGYRYDIIQDALGRVSSALARLGSFAGSEDYAYAIARSIASVLTAHDLIMFSDGLDIGNSMVYQLESFLGSIPSSTFPLSSSFGAASVSSSGWGSSDSDVSSQASGMASVQVNPSYVEPSFGIPLNPQNDKNQFQNRLSYFLSQSQTISESFCSGPVPGIYEIMNSAFYDYGYSISSTIANIVSNSLSMLPTEAACTQYAEIISEIVADILDKNGLILATDPQTLTNKISDVLRPNIQETPGRNVPTFGEETFSGSDYQLNPSFSDFSYYVPEISASPEYQGSSSDISSSEPNTSLQQQIPIPANATEFSFDASSVTETSTGKVLPAESSSGELSLSDESKPSSDESVITNSSWVVVDYPSDVSMGLDQMNLTSGSAAVATSIISKTQANVSDMRNAPESKMVQIYKTTKSPEIGTTKSSEVTTPVPPSTDFQFSTIAIKSEDGISPFPQVTFKDAFESSSEFTTKESTPSNVTADGEKKKSNLPETSDSSSIDLKVPKAVGSSSNSEDSKLAEKSPDSQDELFSDQKTTEVQASAATPIQQSGSPDYVPLQAPAPIADEISALVFAKKVSSIVTSSVGLIRAQNLDFDELCRKLNELAPLVDLPPLDVFSEIPLIDYLLHVLNAVTYSLAGE